MKKRSVLALGLTVMLTFAACSGTAKTPEVAVPAVASEASSIAEASTEKEALGKTPEIGQGGAAEAATPAPSKETDRLTPDQVKKIALDHAGVEESSVTFYKVEQDMDNGQAIYEVEFYSNNTEYDYDIDAFTGAVLKYDEEISFVFTPIEAEVAKKTALERVPGAGDEHIKIEQDLDHGVLVYEGEIVYDGQEYEFKIDAATNTVIEWRQESVFR